MDKRNSLLNILFILPEYHPHSGGGISTYYLHYIKALKPYCDRIKVIVGSGFVQSNSVYSLDGIDIEYLKVDTYNSYLDKFSKYDLMPEFKRHIAAAWAMHHQSNGGSGFDIIECTDFGLGFIPWLIKHHKPVITRLHGSTGQIHLHEGNQSDTVFADSFMQAELLLLQHCDRLVTHSKANQAFWNEVLDENVVNIKPVFTTSVKQLIPFAKRENYGLVAARIQSWKGPIELCEAMAVLNDADVPEIKWFGRDMPYTGGRSMSDYLKSTFPAIWHKHIIPQKPIKSELIQAMQQKAKFGIVPSTWDMFNFTCLEFLAAGTPLICSEGAGCSDLITHGKDGLKYQAADIGALAECLRKMDQMGEQEYNSMALAGLEIINNNLSADELMKRNLEEYTVALAGFKAKILNQFLDTIYSPSDHGHDIKDVLDGLPLKRLMKYVLKRIKGKIRGNLL